VGEIKQVPGAAWEAIKTGVAWSLQWIVDQVKSAPGSIADAARGMFDGIKEAFKSALNWIIDKWNSLEFKIPGYDPPGPGPKFDGFTLSVPQLPRFHSGGVIPGPIGREVPILAQAGETVLSIPQTRGLRSVPSFGGGSVTNHFTILEATDAKETAREVAKVLNQQTRNGHNPLYGGRQKVLR
jgi:hypothetical protein